jgi:hypothetical protein
MSSERFNPDNLDDQRENNLLHPKGYPAMGTVGVYITRSTVGGDYVKPDFFQGEGQNESTHVVHRPLLPRTDVIVGDEGRNRITVESVVQPIVKGPLAPLAEKVYRARVLHAIENGFDIAAVYAAAAEEPVDLEHTYSDRDRWLER